MAITSRRVGKLVSKLLRKDLKKTRKICCGQCTETS